MPKRRRSSPDRVDSRPRDGPHAADELHFCPQHAASTLQQRVKRRRLLAVTDSSNLPEPLRNSRCAGEKSKTRFEGLAPVFRSNHFDINHDQPPNSPKDVEERGEQYHCAWSRHETKQHALDLPGEQVENVWKEEHVSTVGEGSHTRQRRRFVAVEENGQDVQGTQVLRNGRGKHYGLTQDKRRDHTTFRPAATLKEDGGDAEGRSQSSEVQEGSENRQETPKSPSSTPLRPHQGASSPSPLETRTTPSPITPATPREAVLVLDWVDHDFGKRLSKAFQANTTRAAVIRDQRIQKYGARIAEQYAPGRTPSPVRRVWRERVHVSTAAFYAGLEIESDESCSP